MSGVTIQTLIFAVGSWFPAVAGAALADVAAPPPAPDGLYCLAGGVQGPLGFEPTFVVEERLRRPSFCPAEPPPFPDGSSRSTFHGLLPMASMPFTACKHDGRWSPQSVSKISPIDPAPRSCDPSSYRLGSMAIDSSGMVTGRLVYHCRRPDDAAIAPGGIEVDDEAQDFKLSLESYAYDTHYRSTIDQSEPPDRYCPWLLHATIEGDWQFQADWTQREFLYCGTSATCRPPSLRVLDPEIPSWPLAIPEDRLSFRQDLIAHASDTFAVAADGTSRAVVMVESGDSTPLKLALCSGSCIDSSPDGSLGELSKLPPNFWPGDPETFPAGGGPTVVVTPERLAGLSPDRFFAFALFTPPPKVPTANFGAVAVGLYSEEGSLLTSTALSLRPPPLVLIHGLWDYGTTWLQLKQRLDGSYPAPSIVLADYHDSSSRAFTDSETQESLDFAIFLALAQAHAQGVVATRVDVIAHSMGGLVTRAYARGDDHLSAYNYMQGPVRRLFTVGTPHRGSELADWLLAHQLMPVADRCWVAALALHGLPLLKDFMAAQKMPLGSAIGSLSVAYGNFDTVLAPAAQLPYRAIVGIAPSSSGNRLLLDSIIACYDGKESGGHDSVDSILDLCNDTIVGCRSAEGDAAEIKREIVVHASRVPLEKTETNDADVFADLEAFLAEAPPPTGLAALRAQGYRPRTSGGAVSLGDLNFLALTPIPSEQVGVSPADGASLSALTPVAISAGADGKDVTRLVVLLGAQLGDVTEPPFTWTWTPERPGAYEADLLVLFADGTYGSRRVTYQVFPEASLVDLVVEPRRVELERAGASLALLPRALFATGSYDVRSLASYTLAAGGERIVRVNPEGKVIALGTGSTAVKVSYLGRTATVPIQVGKLGSRGFFTLPPCRALDTRTSTGPYGGPALTAGARRQIGLTGICGIPQTAMAVAANLTVVPGRSAGELAVSAANQPQPPFGILHFRPGVTRAIGAILQLSRDGDGAVVPTIDAGAGVDLIIDVMGYFN